MLARCARFARAPLRHRSSAADAGSMIAPVRNSNAAVPCFIPMRAVLALVAALSALLLLAVPAGGVVEHCASPEVEMQPRNEESVLDGGSGASFANANGNPVVHSNSTYAIFWDPTATGAYHGDWQHL